MNYTISTYANRVEGNRGFVIESKGRILDEKISKFEGENIKENALQVILQGIRACRNLPTHDDILIIEVQNSHLCKWLNGAQEYSGYAEYLDPIFELIETLDCRYHFYYNNKPFAKSYIKGKDTTKVSVGSVDDMMADFE